MAKKIKSKTKHKDVEFHVQGDDRSAKTDVFDDLREAGVHAIAMALSRGQPVRVDVVIHSRAGAKWYGGDEAVEMYDEDPDASVSDRIVIRAESLGRIA